MRNERGQKNRSRQMFCFSGYRDLYLLSQVWSSLLQCLLQFRVLLASSWFLRLDAVTCLFLVLSKFPEFTHVVRHSHGWEYFIRGGEMNTGGPLKKGTSTTNKNKPSDEIKNQSRTIDFSAVHLHR